MAACHKETSGHPCEDLSFLYFGGSTVYPPALPDDPPAIPDGDCGAYLWSPADLVFANSALL